jgi:hypothetical protein
LCRLRARERRRVDGCTPAGEVGAVYQPIAVGVGAAARVDGRAELPLPLEQVVAVDAECHY